MYKKKGIINLLKPPGVSSFKAIGRVKKILNHPKAGHTGTLDPRACGVLPICFGRATKVIPYLPEEDKEYIAEITLGKTTDTLDSEGTILSENDKWLDLSINEIKEAINKISNKKEQLPPMYSAVKKDGKRLYKIARKGEKIERETRKVNIKDTEITFINLPKLRLKIRCSKGTYIRSFARDLGEELNCGAYLSFLIRSKSGPFLLKNTYTYKMIEKEIDENKDDFLLPMDQPLDYPKLTLRKSAYKKAINGAILDFDDFKEKNDIIKGYEKVLVYSDNNEFISINEIKKNKEKVKALRVFRIKS
ncbi:MAG: tRNA pseudouridine(55) synthase TruB [Bacillota bacterium]